MAGTSDFLSLCSTSITVAALSTFNSYGAPVFSTDVFTYPAAVEYASRVIHGADGKEEVATATVYVMSSSASIGPQDRITLPLDTSIRVLRVDPVHDEEGLHHWMISCG